MDAKDFHKGDTVFLFCLGSRCTNDEQIEKRIREAKVLSVGRKYITVEMSLYHKEKFDINNGFTQVTPYSADYQLYLSKDDIFEEKRRENLKWNLYRFFSNQSNINKLTDEDLKLLQEIVDKYSQEKKRWSTV